jgi:hypothetical protein
MPTSEMDVSRVDPEEVLVDAQNVELGDVSGDIDEALLRSANHGNEDKVLVSIRCVYLYSYMYLILTLALGSDPQTQLVHGTQPAKLSSFNHSMPSHPHPHLHPLNTTLTRSSLGQRTNPCMTR